jgi:hypothetical protein
MDNPERAKKRDAAVNSFKQSFDEIIILDRADRIARSVMVESERYVSFGG